MPRHSERKAANVAQARAAQARAVVARVAAAIGLGGAGRKIARALVRRGITTRRALRRPSILAALPKAARVNVLYGTGRTRAPLTIAEAAANELKERMEFCIPTKMEELDKKEGACRTLPIVIVGSVRRQTPTVKDLDILVVLPARSKIPLGDVLKSMRVRPKPGGKVALITTYARGQRHCGFIIRYGTGRGAWYFHTDMFLATAAEKPFALFHYTGDATYNVRTRALAKKNGMRLNQYGLFNAKTGDAISDKIKTERDIATTLGITYRAPTDRNSPSWMVRPQR